MKVTHQKSLPGFIYVFNGFSENEAKNFIKFTENSYFSKKRSYKIILKTLRKFNFNGINKQTGNVLEEIQKNTGLNKRALWNRFSELNGIAEYFIVNEKLRQNELLRKNIYIEELSARNQSTRLKQETAKVIKLINNISLSDETFFQIQNIYREISMYFSEVNDFKNSMHYNNLQWEYTLLHFSTSIYKQLLNSELRKRNNIADESMLEESLLESLNRHMVLDYLKQKVSKAVYPAEIYYNLYLAFKEPGNEKNYGHARELFMNNKELFSVEFKNSIYQYLRNYCIDKTNRGEAEFYKEIFVLNNSIIEEGLFKDLNVVNSRTNNFRNFVFAALRLNEYRWVEKFIAEHSRELPDEIRSDEINLNTGILKINEKEYETALMFLKKVQRKRYLQYLDTSVYKLIIYYETDDIEESYRETARLKDYLRKHKDIPVYLKTGYQKFIKLFEGLLKLQQKYDLTENEWFIVQMEPLKNVGLGSWLYEKSIEMLNEKSK